MLSFGRTGEQSEARGERPATSQWTTGQKGHRKRNGGDTKQDSAEQAQRERSVKCGQTARKSGGKTYGKGQPSEIVSGKVAVRVGVAGVSSAVAKESILPSGMDPSGLAAERWSKERLGSGWSLASPAGMRAGDSAWWVCLPGAG